MDFLGSAELLSHFAVYGRFYEKTIAGVPEQLRDRLEIAPHEMPLREVLRRDPDLLVVMMNPGGSRPLDSLWAPADAEGFAAAQPDRTQYQIMRLLLRAQALGLNWQHARVLNLSDLRTPKSAVFVQKLHDYADDDRHSVFSQARSEERRNLFGKVATPILLGWGLNAAFVDLATKALAAAQGHPLLGLSDDGVRYRHPLPQRHDFQVTWLEQVAVQIRALSASTAI
jgi:hypothetical protein